MRKERNKKGFTLIELLAIIIVLGLVVSFVSYFAVDTIKKNKEKTSEISTQTLYKSALLYATEYKKNDENWFAVVNTNNNNNLVITQEFTCVTVKSLIDKGFLKNNIVDSTTGQPINPNSYIKILRDKETNAYIKEDNSGYLNTSTGDCESFDPVVPNINYTVTGNSGQNNMWYSSVRVSLEAEVGISGVKSIEYYVKDSNRILSNINIANGSNAVIEYDVTTNGRNIKVCGIITNGIENRSREICSEPFNLDSEIPTKPELVSSDSIASSIAHTNQFFDLKINNSKSVSTITNYYDINATTNYRSIGNTLPITTTENGKTVYVKSCNQADLCSEISDYKINITIPSNNRSNSGSSSRSNSSSGSSSSSSSSSGCSATCQMKKNSETWHVLEASKKYETAETAGTAQREQERLHEVNVQLAKNNSACNSGCTYDSNGGSWSVGTSTGSQKYLYTTSNFDKQSSSSSSSSSSGSKSSKSSSSSSSSSSSKSSSSSSSSSVSTKISSAGKAIVKALSRLFR